MVRCGLIPAAYNVEAVGPRLPGGWRRMIPENGGGRGSNAITAGIGGRVGGS